MLGPDYVKPSAQARRKPKPVRFRLLRSVLGIITVALLTVTLAGFAGGLGHSFELLSHFKVQFLVLGVLCGVACLLMREARWGWVAWAIVVVNGAAVAPWFFGKPAVPAGTGVQDVKFLLSNVLTSNPNAQPFLDLVKAEQPDVLVLQEVNQHWMGDLKSLYATYPHRIVEPREDNFGIAVLSRKPLAGSRAVEIGAAGVPSIITDVQVSSAAVSLLATHPLPPINPDYTAQRNKQLEAVAGAAKQQKHPVVLLGDLNLTMWSPYYARLIQESGLRNARHGFGVLPTWPADQPALLIPLDHCLLSPELGVRNIQVGPDIGSDHKPLIVTITVPPQP